MFQHYQFDRDAIALAAEAVAATLAETRPAEVPEAFAASVVARRLRREPGSYLQYGPYWWSVKHALRATGQVFGNTDNAIVRAAYTGGRTALQILVAGEQFREYYQAHLMAGTGSFALGGEGDADAGEYTLLDMDMEILRHLPAGAGSRGIGEQVGHEPDEPILDDVRVRFEEGGELWTAVIEGGLLVDGTNPGELIAQLQRSGQVGRAIDMAKDLRSTAIDGSHVVTAQPSQHLVRIARLPP